MKKLVYGVLAFAPVVAFAQTANLNGIQTLVQQIGQIIGLIIPILFAVAIIVFFWGLITYIRKAGDPKGAAEGRSIMIWGVIAIAVMVSIYGLVNWLQSSLGITNTTTISLPKVPGVSQ